MNKMGISPKVDKSWWVNRLYSPAEAYMEVSTKVEVRDNPLVEDEERMFFTRGAFNVMDNPIRTYLEEVFRLYSGGLGK